MRKTPGIAAATAVAMLAFAAPASAEPTRESYKVEVEPICKANREANQRIMAPVRSLVKRGDLKLAGKRFFRVSRSFGGMVKRLATVPPPPADDHRVDRWLQMMGLLETRLHNVGEYLQEGLRIKANHELILAERAGLSANNITVVFGFSHCRLTRIG